MTLPPCYSWSPVGKRLRIAYEAPQGRRLNAIGAYVSHGPDAGTFRWAVYAGLPKSTSKKRRKSAEEIAAASGFSVAEVGPVDSERFLAFVWQLAGRSSVFMSNWKRSRPLWIVLDNYSVHKSEAVQQAEAVLEAANIRLLYLPSYSPKLSDIEPIWQTMKHHEMPVRSYSDLKVMKQAVEEALAKKARNLMAAQAESENLLCRAA